jgi:hypothetical protein
VGNASKQARSDITHRREPLYSDGLFEGVKL